MESAGRLSSERTLKHYSNFHQILLVGEGDFSFSLALANAFGSAENMVTTSLDSKEKLLELYKSAHETLLNLEKLGAMVLHGVDATTMEKHHLIRKMLFHRIVFNFPHAGFHGPEDDKRVLKKHRHLLKMFFTNTRTMLSEIGEIHVTHKETGPYKKWELVKQAQDCGLNLKESVHFTIEDYPGYTNRKGSGKKAGRTFFLGKCRTYKFILGPGLLHKRKLMAMQVVLSNFSSEDSAENFETAYLKSESGETRKADSETLINRLEMLLDVEINTNDEFAREMTEALHQMAQSWRVKTNIAEKLDEALDAINRKQKSLTDAIMDLESERRARKVAETEKVNLQKSLKSLQVILNKELKRLVGETVKKAAEAVKVDLEKSLIMDLESERQARKVAETEKVNLQKSLKSLQVNLNEELNKNVRLKRERDEAFLQREEAEAAEAEKVYSEKSLNNLKVVLSKELQRNNELEKQRDAAFLQRKAAETQKVDLEKSLNHLNVILSKELRRNNELERQRDAAVLQGEKICREKTSIAKQLDEALAKDAAKKRDDDRGSCAALFVLFILFIIYFCR